MAPVHSGSSASAAAGALTMAGAAGAGASAFCCGFAAGAGAASALSPSSVSTMIGVLTATFSVPSAIRSLPTTPSSTASTSMVALSVSISQITMPEVILSPSLTCHLASLPSVIVGDSAGISTLMAMTWDPFRSMR